MEEKKVTKIKLSTAILCFIIFVLIVLSVILYCFGFVNKNEQNTLKEEKIAKDVNDIKNEVSINETLNNTTSKESNKNKQDKKEQGKDLDINGSEVKKIVEKFNFGVHSETFYQVGDFDSTNIPNILKLRLGWMKINPDEKNANSEILRETVKKESVEKSIKNIFGKNIKYEDKTFRFGNTSVFDQLSTDMVYYNEDKEEYEAGIFQGGGAYWPLIYEKVQNAVEYDNKVELYVKTGFINPENISEHGENCTYAIYDNYDFNKEQFENKVIGIDSKEFEEESDYSVQLSTKSKKSVENVLNKLNTYKYTFKKENGEYYLSGFSKE